MAQKPIKVSKLNSYIKRILASDPLLGNVNVTGEISNFKHHSNGHVYFTLKDDLAGVNCFLPGGVFNKLRFEIGDGIEVVVNGYINVYEKGGSYSLNIKELMVEGAGNLAVAFEKLKIKLEEEGLFDSKYKKPIPKFPKTIAIVTSNTGAAIEDMLKIITTKNNYVDVLIFPTLVQGPSAAGEIAAGIKYLNTKHTEVETIIIGRGGGSAEDLWAFNEEVLARAIFDSRIPIISAVGHEVDVTISDFVADFRAETPTAAAQMAVPHIEDIIEYIEDRKSGLTETMQAIISYNNDKLALKNISNLAGFLATRIRASKVEVEYIVESIKSNIESMLSKLNHQLIVNNELLIAYNPKNIMDRGYAALVSKSDRKLISSVSNVEIGEKLVAVLKDGSIELTADDIIGGNDVK